jgi:hypothetical protein
MTRPTHLGIELAAALILLAARARDTIERFWTAVGRIGCDETEADK